MTQGPMGSNIVMWSYAIINDSGYLEPQVLVCDLSRDLNIKS
jgi:hypothetical protein